MDHIPIPPDSFPDLRARAVLPIVAYDFQDFATFGARCGFTDESARSMTEVERARHLQSWLFFGLLAEALQGDFQATDFITASDDTPDCSFLSLSCLQVGLQRALSRPSGLARGSYHVKDACDLAWAKVNHLERLGCLISPRAGETGLAILVLVQTLQVMTEGPDPGVQARIPWDSAFLTRYMVDREWCPQQAAAVLDSYDPLVACYLARLKRADANPVRMSHERCTPVDCRANNVNLDNSYRHRHVSEDCTCEFVAVDAVEAKSIIDQGGIPLVSITQQENGRVALVVSKASATSDYIAISHVWSDGLGNPIANALPQCQVERILNCLAEMKHKEEVSDDHLYLSVRIQEVGTSSSGKPAFPWYLPKQESSTPSVSFWMDTLCIPVAAPDASPVIVSEVNRLKSVAINQMALIYAGASQVLVLDSDLQQAVLGSYKGADIELLARFVTSTWMRRCWTLQEGALARAIRFQSGSGIATPLVPTKSSLESITQDITQHFVPWIVLWGIGMYTKHRKVERKEKEAAAAARTDPVLSHLRYRLQESARQVTNLLPRGLQSHNILGQASPESQLNQFCTVWNSLAVRNTTMSSDISAIFANLLDLNAYQILSLPSSSRMKAILASLDLLPIDLLFVRGPRSPTATTQLERWIPHDHNRVKIRAGGDISSRALVWTETGQLECSCSRRLLALAVKDVQTLQRSTDFVIKLDNGSHSNMPQEFLVRFHRPDSDDLRRESFREAVLFINTESGDDGSSQSITRGNGFLLVRPNSGGVEEMPSDISQGVRAQLNGEQRDNMDASDGVVISGVYDCPFTWSVIGPNETITDPVLAGHLVRSKWNMKIQTDPGLRIRKYLQRPYYQNLCNAIHGTFMFTGMVPILYANMVSVVLRIIIELRIGWANLSLLGRAATIVFALDASQVLAFVTPPPLAQTLFIVDRQRADGSLSAIDKAYVILSLIGNTWMIALAFRFARFASRHVAYRMWLQSFGPDWPDTSGILSTVFAWGQVLDNTLGQPR